MVGATGDKVCSFCLDDLLDLGAHTPGVGEQDGGHEVRHGDTCGKAPDYLKLLMIKHNGVAEL